MQPTELLALADCPPTHFYVPDGARFTLADEVADLMESVGYQVDAEERAVCYALYPQQANGDWIGLDSGIVCSRQNLKTACEIGGALHDTFVQGQTVGWTSHEFKTSTAAFRDFQAVIEGNDWLAAEVLKIRTGSVDPGFELRNGARLDIIARTGKSGRGMARPRLYLDEALYLVASMMGAIVPTMSAMPNAHMVIGSSPGLKESRILRGYRKRGRTGTDPHLGWIEWSQEQQPCEDPECRHEVGTPGCWLDDLAAVLRVNPAAPRRISLDYIPQERLSLESAPEEYLRERMGVWEDPVGPDDTDPLLPNWTDVCDLDAVLPEGVSAAWSVDVQWLPPGSGRRPNAWISAGVEGEDDKPVVQVVHVCDPAAAVGWLDEWARKRPLRGIAVQGTGAPASALLSDLRATFDEPKRELIHAMTGPELSAACQMAATATRTGAVVCRRAPLDDAAHAHDVALDLGVNLGLAKPLAGAWVLDRIKSPVDTAPVTSWINAHWLLVTTPEPDIEPGVWFL